MYHSQPRSLTPSSNNEPPRERLPPFLLSSNKPNGSPSAPTNFPPRYNRDGGVRPASFSHRSQSALTSSEANWSRRFGGITPNALGNNTTAPIAFNDRLRTDRSSIQFPPSTETTNNPSNLSNSIPGITPQAPTHMPPNKSMLDTGPASVVNIHTPHVTATPSGFAPVGSSLTPTGYGRMSLTPTGNKEGTESWVTVFGFPATMESQVMRELRRDGEIVKSIPGRGNWVHILFRTSLQANVALNRPWRLLAGTDVMIGTVTCTEPSVARQAEEQVNKGMLLASPGVKDIRMDNVGFSPAEIPALQSIRKSGTSANGANLEFTGRKSPALHGHHGLRTPASILRRDQGVAVGPNSIVKTPQRQTGILQYLTGFL